MMPHAEDEKAQLVDEKAQLEASAKHANEYGFKPTGGDLSLADAFRLQFEDRFWKGKRREGPYKTEASFVAALSKENLTWRRFNDVEKTTEKAVEALFELLLKRRRAADSARKRAVKRQK
jgi:hypothetical protein